MTCDYIYTLFRGALVDLYGSSTYCPANENCLSSFGWELNRNYHGFSLYHNARTDGYKHTVVSSQVLGITENEAAGRRESCGLNETTLVDSAGISSK